MPVPRLLGHRGAGALAPENTLSSLTLAARLGLAGVEFDVQADASGRLLLLHDDTLERTTTGHGPLAVADPATLDRLDAGRRFHPAFAGEPLPTLAQALATCHRLGLFANVEIKLRDGVPPAQAHALGAAVARAVLASDGGTPERILLSSFHPEALAGAQASAPHLPRGLLCVALPADPVATLAPLEATWLIVAADTLHRQSPAALRALCQGAPQLAAYTEDDPDRAAWLWAAGVRTLITDRPDRLLPARAGRPS